MISVIMPYWNRSKALLRSLNAYNDCYSDLDIEFIVVDDGSEEKPEIPEGLEIDVRVITLPSKPTALNPCIPINVGAREAEGDILVITNPEILHTKEIFSDMRKELTALGATGYVAAATLSVEKKKWYCHSSIDQLPGQYLGRAPVPKGAGLHFCAMLHKAFFFEIGGFDEEYREGQAYDDNDFLWTLYAADAVFHICDNLVVYHYNSYTKWPVGGIDRNKKLFYNKWQSYLS